MWVLQMATAFVPAGLAAAAAQGLTAHRSRRDTTERLLRDYGVRPVPTEPAYATPQPVTDGPSAVATLVTAESDLTVTWRAVIERTDDSGLRKVALDSLVDSAVRAARWRAAAASGPTTIALPGQV